MYLVKSKHMNKKLFETATMRLILALFLSLGYTVTVRAQSCSVNAGVPTTICKGATMTLFGNSTGGISISPSWAFVSGPNTPTITSPSSATTTVTGYIAGVYKFRYFATCTDASVASDTVTITVDSLGGVSAGPDVFTCGKVGTMNGILPAGATGVWSLVNINTADGSPTLSATTGTSTTITGGSAGYACPHGAQVIYSATRGACIVRDTALFTFANEVTPYAVVPDQTICGTTSYTTPYYGFGCGGSVVYGQLAGPSIATISATYPLGTSSYSQGVFSNLLVGTYTFTVAVTSCSGIVFKDTFNVTNTSTVVLTDPGIATKYLCPRDFDTVYYFAPTVALLPGETMTWDLSYISASRASAVALPPVSAIMDTSVNTLRVRGLLHPDTNSTANEWTYSFRYTISNGTCSRTTTVGLYLYSPRAPRAFIPVYNLPCGATSIANIAQAINGSVIKVGSISAPTAIVKPSGAPTPILSTGTSGDMLSVSGLQAGKYIIQFRFADDYCTFSTRTVELNVSSPPSLVNAGTDQVLPCGTTSTTIAGNTPLGGETGTWYQVSGPSTVTFIDPHNPSATFSGLALGTYTFKWTILNGLTCPANEDIMTVTVVAPPSTVTAGVDRTVCYAYPLSLTGSSYGAGTSSAWTQIGGPAVTITGASSPLATITGTVASTVYTFKYTVTNSCGSLSDTVVITTGSSAGPSAAVISTADACLSSTSTTLTAVAPTSGTGAWTQLSGPSAATIASPSSNTTSVSGLIAGAYQFIWSVTASGCDTLRDTVSVAYSTGSLTSNAGADRYICQDSVHLAANTPALGAGTWTQIGGAPSTIVSPNSASSAITGLVGGNTYDYVWTVSLGVCPAAKDSVHIVTFAPPSAAVARTDTLICGTTIPFLGRYFIPISATAPTIGIGVWTIVQSPYSGPSTPSSVTSSTSTSTTLMTYQGLTLLVWNVTNGVCPASKDTVVVEIVPKADIQAGAATVAMCQVAASSTVLSATDPGTGTALWSQISGPSTATISQPNEMVTNVSGLTSVGTYQFKYDVTRSGAGCSSSDTISVIVSSMPTANAGRDSMYCSAGASTVLYLNATAPTVGTTGLWSKNIGTGTPTYAPSASSNVATATVAGTGLYQFLWSVTNGGCVARDYVDIVVVNLAKPTVAFTPIGGCNDSFTVSATTLYPSLKFAWSMPAARISDTTGYGLVGPITNNFLINGSNKIYLTMTDTVSGCAARDTSTISVVCFASLGNKVWRDDDKDGIQDVGEPGVAGVTVTLYRGTTVIGTTITDAYGNYLFDNLSPGNNYSIKVTPPSNYSFTTQGTPGTSGAGSAIDCDVNAGGISAAITLTDGQAQTDVDAGLIYETTTISSIGDKVWMDTDADGVQDPGESGIAGVTVSLYKETSSGSGVYVIYMTTTTDANGNYLFNNLPNNTNYKVAVSPLPNTVFTTSTGTTPGDATTNSDVDAATGLTAAINIPSTGAQIKGIDAGLKADTKSSLGNRVWNDLNHDGIQDAAEPGVPNVVMTLWKQTTPGVYTSVGTATTDANGIYIFTGLDSGTYRVTASVPSAYTLSLSNAGTNDEMDNDFVSSVSGVDTTGVYNLLTNQDYAGIDMGIYNSTSGLGSIGDKVWADTDGNGIQDAGELGLAGVSVSLLDGSGNPVNNPATGKPYVLLTDANGNYKFVDIPAGTYQVKFSNLPANTTLSATGAGTTSTDSDPNPTTGITASFSLSAGQNKTDVDAGVMPYTPSGLASIGDKVWIDADNDGIQDIGEQGVGGVTVTLYAADGTTVIATTTTNSAGNYIFSGLSAGNYIVGFSGFPSGYSLQTGKNDLGGNDLLDSDPNPSTGKTALISLIAGQDNFSVDAGIYNSTANNSIGDKVWLDQNADGLQTVGEPGVPGVTVNLIDNATGNIISSIMTDASGNYSFKNLPNGNYRVQVVLPTGMSYTTQNAGAASDSNINSKINPLFGTSNQIVLSGGVNITNIDAGLTTTRAMLGDRVWNDIDGDGIQDIGESGIAGVTVTLYAADGTTVISSTVTDANGNYLFSNLNAGSYVVGFGTLPSGMVITTKDATGSTPSTGSDANVSTGKTDIISLAAGAINMNVDAGLTPQLLGAVSGIVWFDKIANAVRTSDEPLMPGVTVILKDPSGNVIGTTMTNGDGSYLFTNVPAGTGYTVTFSNYPSGSSLITQTTGTTDGSDASPGTGVTPPITVVGGATTTHVDAGFDVFTPLPISLQKFGARIQQCSVVIHWESGVESEVKHFIVRRSTNGINYTTIASVEPKGSNSTYSIMDNKPNIGRNIYRLDIVDIDADMVSQTTVVNMDCGQAATVTVYPNPASDQLQIVLQGNSMNNNYELIDALGRVILKGILNANSNNPVDVSAVARGVYMLKVITDGNVSTQQVQIAK